MMVGRLRFAHPTLVMAVLDPGVHVFVMPAKAGIQ
jgi:hypothetical protein